MPDLEEALARLPDRVAVELCPGCCARFMAPGDLEIEVVEEAGVPYDLREVVLYVPDPDATAEALADLGFERRDDRLAIAEKALRLEPGEGDANADGRMLLNHIALLVDSAEAVESEARRRGLEVADVVDAENTLAVFVWGPDRIKLEYVEHKPSFALT